MSSLQEKKEKLIKFAVFMRDGYGYQIPEGAVSKAQLTPKFAAAAKAYAGEFYVPEVIKKITDFSGAHPKLAEDMLKFWRDSGEGKKGATLNRDAAEKGLKQMEQHGFLSRQMG